MRTLLLTVCIAIAWFPTQIQVLHAQTQSSFPANGSYSANGANNPSSRNEGSLYRTPTMSVRSQVDGPVSPSTQSNVQPAAWNAPAPSVVSNLPVEPPRIQATTRGAIPERKAIELKSPSKGLEGSVEKPKSTSANVLTMVFALTIVVSLFLIMAWLLRKSQPASFVKLPGDVVQVMGRTPMAPRQQMYVVRFGSKLLLVSHQPGQTQTLCEITDPDEVQRLAGLCEANMPSSISGSFRDVFQQIASGKPLMKVAEGKRTTRGRSVA